MIRQFLLAALLLTFYVSSATTPKSLHLPLGLKFGMNVKEITHLLGKKPSSESTSEVVQYAGVKYQNRPAVVKSYFKKNQLYLVSIEMQADVNAQADFSHLKQAFIDQYGHSSTEAAFDTQLQAATCQWTYKNGFTSLVIADGTIEIFFANTALSDSLSTQVLP